MKKILFLMLIFVILGSCSKSKQEVSEEKLEKDNEIMVSDETTKVEDMVDNNIEMQDEIEEKGEVVSFSSKEIYNQVGSVITNDPDASENDSIKATKSVDWPGSLWHNMPIILDKWNYRIFYSMKIDSRDVSGVIAWMHVDVLDDKERKIYNYNKEIYTREFENNSYNKFSLDFEVMEDDTKVIPWAYYNGEQTIYLDDISIIEIEGVREFSLKWDGSIVFEERELWTKTWKITFDEDASNKYTLVWVEGRDKADHMVFWPYSEKELPGDHRALFRMKTSDNSKEDIIAWIEVFNSNWDWLNKALFVKGTDFEENDVYQDFEIDFLRTDKWSMEYRVYYYWITDFSLDNITIFWLEESQEENEEVEEKTVEVVKEEPLEEEVSEVQE